MPTIKELRLRNGLTQKQLAKATGIGERSIWKWENGFAKPQSQSLWTLANYFHILPTHIHQPKERRRFSPEETQELVDKIFSLARTAEQKFGTETRFWNDNDPDVKKLLELGYYVSGVRRKIETVHHDKAKLDKDWARILKCYTTHSDFSKLPIYSRCSWQYILWLDRLHGGYLQPTFYYYAMPIRRQRRPVYACSKTAMIRFLHISQSIGSDFNKYAPKHGYWVMHGKYPWDRVGNGDIFIIEAMHLNPVYKHYPQFWENLA